MRRTAPPGLVPPLSEKDHVRGAPEATVTLIGYADFACPECVKSYRIVKKIQAKMGPRLRYVFRSFPQPREHPRSLAAAEAAESASSQGKFWEMHDRLFESEGASDEFGLSRCATEVGLDLERFGYEMRTHAHLAEIRAVRREGVRSGVVEVPTFFINWRHHRSNFGVTTLLPAVQAAGGGA